MTVPCASIDHPTSADTVGPLMMRVAGWAMGVGGPPARVELTVDGRPVGRARVGYLRPDVAHVTGITAAGICGYEASVELRRLPWVGEMAVLGGFAVGLDGETVPLPPVKVRIAECEPQGAEAARALDDAREDLDGRGATQRFATSPRHARSAPADGLRLLVPTHQLDWGGAQLFLVELLRQLADQVGASGLVISPTDGPTRGVLEEVGFDVHVTTPYPLDSLRAYEVRLQELSAWTKLQSFDAALVNSLVSFPGGDLAHRMELPSVWAIHESYPLPGYWATFEPGHVHPAVRECGERALRAGAAVVFEADATRALYEPDLAGVRCLTRRYGIDVDELDRWRAGFDRVAAREQESIPRHATVVLCVGTIEPRKGQTQLVRAFAEVARRHSDALLVLVGSRGDDNAWAAQLAVAGNELADRVRILPIVDDVRPFYAMADLMVCASDVESLPRSVLEAMALGLPVLSTSVFGLPELIEHEHTGWLCEPRDVIALAQALNAVLALDEQARRTVARRARALIETQHRSDHCTRAWGELLVEVAGGNVSGAPVA